MKKSSTDQPIAIVGAGFAGLAMAIELLKVGIEEFVIFEMADEVGGTWRDNIYPGCACDVPSHFYSFSFEPNPGWSCTYSPQEEIQEYILRVAEKYSLYDYIRFNTEIRGAKYDEERCFWTLRSAGGEEFEARAVVMGVGGLSRPKIPELDGLDDFGGDLFHSAQWEEEVELAGKRVAVVGTGASAVQLVPAIVDEVEALTVYQRTPPWVIPRRDWTYPESVKQLFERFPTVHQLFRYLIYLRNEALGVGFVTEPRLMELFSMWSKRHARAVFDDPAMIEAVTPDYLMGCKRVVFSEIYYPALARDHVELVPHGVERLTEKGAVDATGEERAFDVIVMATGFHVTDFLSYFEVIGRGGVDLNEAWREGAEAYLGVAVSRFPNLFIMVGPNTALGHNSIIYMIECQAHLIRQCIEAMDEGGADAIEVRPAVHREFNEQLQERLAETVWNTGCQSWYLDESGKNTTIWPGYTFEYWLRTRRLNRDHFRLSWRGEHATTEA